MEIRSKYYFTKDSLIRGFSLIENTSKKELTKAIHNNDKKRVQNIVEEFLKSKHILGISIKLIDNVIVYEKGTLSNNEKDFNTYQFDFKKSVKYKENMERFTYFLNSNNKQIAKVNIYYHKDEIFKIIKNDIIYILIFTFVKLITLFLLFIYFIYHIITAPLKKIIEATRNLDGVNRTFIDLDNTKKYTELNELADSFNYMSKRVVEEFEKVKKLNLKLKKQKEDLIEANEYKNFFLANISHELKTPLNPITLISSVLIKNKNSDLSEKTINELKVINKSATELKILIDDILDLTKIEAKDVKINYQEVNLKEIIEKLLNNFKLIAATKELDFEVNISLENEIQIIDILRFNQICKNLISNAIKFTHKGSIKIEVNETKTQIELNVIDTGIGISEKNLEKIFYSFKQLDASLTRKYGGTGLGLYISKKLAKLHDGDILVKSIENEGSCFSFVFNKKDKKDISVKSEKLDKIEEHIQVENILKNKQEDKKEIIIINNNPLLFFEVGVFLNKQININLNQFDSVLKAFEYIKKYNLEKTILIIEVTKDEEILKNIKEQFDIKIVGIGQSDSKIYNNLISKPIDCENLLKYIKDNS
ncbi:ATP-binding protein [Arcobacter sp. CECT 8985]|uniref:ATP-binding protein n=1 Tax=Arcobacter sp. CECT 8985 TaxID=1935424 RepID=UPI0013E905DF|nr:ATP-binding protein [Arcobacter sp. CECT 8985]